MDSNFLTYNALDSACTLEVHNAIWPELSAEGFWPAYNSTIDLFEPLMFMMTRGILVDHAQLEATKQDIQKTAAAAQQELNKLCGRDLNVNSPKDCQKYFYLELACTPYYKDGKVTVDDKALQRLANGTAKQPGLRQAKLCQDIRGLQKLYSTYLDIEFDKDGRMRCSYNPRGTKFGRLSSSKTIFGTGTNQQNLPQEFKKFLVADPGMVLWEVDKRQAEWVVVAYLANDLNMISVVESGEDAHIHTAHLMFHQPKEVIAKEAKAVGTLNDPDQIAKLRTELGLSNKIPRNMSMRQCGKKSNHGLNYDEGDRKSVV
jgi:DNA polymerase I-like protein with 3'-5' exonuclease and polymerase domains